MNEDVLEYRVPGNQSKERLDAYLTSHLTASRSQIQKMIKEGQVLVNGVAVKSNHTVQPFEIITVERLKPAPQNAIPEIIPLNIVFEDDYLLVINKAAGMVVHPAVGNRSGTLVNALLHHCNQLSENTDPLRPGIVHRLDKDTSGLLVVAKTDEAHTHLAKQFSDKSAHRNYVALVWGKLKKGNGSIESKIARNPRDRKKMAVSQTGRHAVTHYQVIERFPFLSLCQMRLETGRTHQIRVHMSHIGHPVFGDQTYGGTSRPMGRLNQTDTATALPWLEAMPRQALHAKTLGFIHPHTGEFMKFDSELPDDMKMLLDNIREFYGREQKNNNNDSVNSDS